MRLKWSWFARLCGLLFESSLLIGTIVWWLKSEHLTRGSLPKDWSRGGKNISAFHVEKPKYFWYLHSEEYTLSAQKYGYSSSPQLETYKGKKKKSRWDLTVVLFITRWICWHSSSHTLQIKRAGEKLIKALSSICFNSQACLIRSERGWKGESSREF